MEGRMRKYGHGSPERSRVRAEQAAAVAAPPKQHHRQKQQQQQQQLQPGTRIPVVYYLCRNRHLEHPHFIEVPTSSPEGLYLRDVINRLNVLRGKGMAAMYSWSCKRSYKSGFVWHDLSEDDLILPANGNEYILKGSELLDSSPSDRCHHPTSNNSKLPNPKLLQLEASLASRSQESSPSSSGIAFREANHQPPPSPSRPPLPLPPPQEDELSPSTRRASSSSGNISPVSSKRNSSLGSDGSPSLAEYKVYKPSGAADAATQTEERSGGGRRNRERETCVRGVSTDDGMLNTELDGGHQNRVSILKESSEISREEISPPPASSSTSSSGAKTETLESLIRAEARKMNSFRILEEDDVLFPTGPKLKATNVLMQLITCGSISVKDHHSFGLVHSYKPRFSHVKFPSPMYGSSMMLGELDCLSENPRMVGLKMEDKEYFSGSIIETKKLGNEGEVVPTLKRSSSYNADRTCKSPNPTVDEDHITDSSRSKCLPRSIKITSSKQSKSEFMKSPLSDGLRISSEGPDCSQFTSTSTSKGSSKRFTDASSGKGSSMRLESFKEDKEMVIKIEESLLRELGL